MQYRQLGTTDLQVSRICLGTMTWGGQNTAQDAADQLDYALDHGVNFIDTAEMYAVPTSPESYGKTEEYIGQWIKNTGKRDKIILATKMAGPGMPHVREASGLVPDNVAQAVDNSLKRLNTDVIDLYQLHWPQRQLNVFAQRDFNPHKHTGLAGENMLGMLEALDTQVKAGKIRHIGVSNESPWGMMKYLSLSETHGLPRIQSVQNPYSLLQRNFDVNCSEVAMREKVGLLAYSPLGGGVLSGKYLDGQQPEGARYSTWGKQVMSKHAENADSIHVRQYVDLANARGLTPTQLALAFVNSRPHLTSNIIGATSIEQLKECLSSEEVTLGEDVLDAIEALHDADPSPSLGRTGPRDNS